MARKPPPASKTAKAAPAPKGKMAPAKTPAIKASKEATPKKAPPTNAVPESTKEADAGYVAAKTNAVQYLHSRRQAMFALARRYHLDADDIQQDAYEVLLTCLRDFKPTHTRASGETITVQFNTFFGARLESKALESRNRDPEYQARQAHMADMSDAEREAFRKDPPLLVQHLDQETTMQEHLRGEIASAKRANSTPLGMKLLRDGFMDKKLNELIAAERDDKRRAALLQVKVGGIASFEEIAYHFGVTDSRASQILNELMDAFYVQRLIEGDLKSVSYDFEKLKFQEKRALKLLNDALSNSAPARQQAILETFEPTYPSLHGVKVVEHQASRPSLPMAVGAPASLGHPGAKLRPWADPFTAAENTRYPARGLEWWPLSDLKPLPVSFRPSGEENSGEPAYISQMMEREPDSWPLIVTPQGVIIDGTRRYQAALGRGKEKMLCLVREVGSETDAKILRVASNLRGPRGDKAGPDKMELFHAICALADLGLSQQKIADALGTSRPNVIVYAKVKDKATPKLRALFEDGFIQITNASACVDLPPAAQDGMADFIRKNGSGWGKGPQFGELFEAAAAGKLDKWATGKGAGAQRESAPETVGNIASRTATAPEYTASLPSLHGENSPSSAVVDALKNRTQTLENALRDAEAWNRQREATIARQTQELIDLKGKNDELTRELDAQNLLQHADQPTIQNYLKEIKNFYAVVERLASASYHMEKAGKSLRSQPLTGKQAVEVQNLLENISAHLNAVRVELVHQNRTTPSPNSSPKG